jgi:hypothetical protein
MNLLYFVTQWLEVRRVQKILTDTTGQFSERRKSREAWKLMGCYPAAMCFSLTTLETYGMETVTAACFYEQNTPHRSCPKAQGVRTAKDILPGTIESLTHAAWSRYPLKWEFYDFERRRFVFKFCKKLYGHSPNMARVLQRAVFQKLG